MLDTSTKIGKANILAKMKNVVVMAYATQCLSGMAMLNAIVNIQVASWSTGRVCQLYDNLKCKYNPNDRLSEVQMIKKLNEIKPKKGKDHKVMCDELWP